MSGEAPPALAARAGLRLRAGSALCRWIAVVLPVLLVVACAAAPPETVEPAAEAEERPEAAASPEDGRSGVEQPGAAAAGGEENGKTGASQEGEGEEAQETAVERLGVRVVALWPHDPAAFTQGLLWHEGTVLESTGLYGASSLRRWELDGGRVLDRVDLPAELFGEGLARVGGRLVQLTWREERARVYDLESLVLLEELPYAAEGWGLCFDGRRLVASDGGDRLTFRDPQTLAPVGDVGVTLEGRPVDRLNELECRPEGIYANLLGDDQIVRIDAASGRVTAVIDASGLLETGERAGAEVLNGIAYRPETGTFLLTGKLWPKLFEVELVPPP